MQAIFGLYFFDGRLAEKVTLEKAAEQLPYAHHAGVEYAQDGLVGLVHLLHPLAAGPRSNRQPVRRGACLLTADLRLDNRDDLAKKLKLAAPHAATLSDAERLLHAYEAWGEAMVDHILGDFAFALWDARRKRLFCARDAMGARPFYYVRGAAFFAFSSHVRALLQVPNVPVRLNEDRVAGYLVAHLQDAESTFYEGIFRLPAAHCLSVGPEGNGQKRYWTPDLGKEIRFASDVEYVDAYREALVEAVACRVGDPSSLGAELSGGLDSSTVAGLAALHVGRQGKRLRVFSWALPPDDPWPVRDERFQIDAVAKQSGLEVQYVTASGEGFFSDIDRILDLHGGPPDALRYPLTLAVCEEARGQGLEVLLSGYGGDEVVTYHGGAYLGEMARMGQWRRLIGELRMLADRQGVSWRSLLRHAVLPYLPIADFVRPLLPHRKRGAGLRWQAHSMISPAFGEEMRIGDRLSMQPRLDPHLSIVRQLQWRSFTAGHVSLLSENEAAMAAHYGVAFRYPLQDRRLVALSLAMPVEQHVRQGTGRFLVRRAMAGVVPAAVLNRTDKGAPVPDALRRILAEREGLLSSIDRLREKQQVMAYIDLDKVKKRLTVEMPEALSKGVYPDSTAVIRAVLLARFVENF